MKPLFDTKEALAPVGTKDWAIFCRNKMQVSVDRDRQSEDQFNDYWSEFLENRGWEPLGFKDYREFAMSKRPDGLAMTQRQFLILCEHAVASDADKVSAAKENPLADGPGKPEGAKGGNQHTVANGSGSTKSDQDRSNTYTLRRLARDNPEMLDKIEAGEMSVNQAAIAAGFRKKPSSADVCIKSFQKTENRLDTLRAIIQTLEPHELSVVLQWIKEVENDSTP